MHDLLPFTCVIQYLQSDMCLFFHQGCHISALPLEIFQCILSFAVLPDLDLRTLEQFGMVCII